MCREIELLDPQDLVQKFIVVKRQKFSVGGYEGKRYRTTLVTGDCSLTGKYVEKVYRRASEDYDPEESSSGYFQSWMKFKKSGLPVPQNFLRTTRTNTIKVFTSDETDGGRLEVFGVNDFRTVSEVLRSMLHPITTRVRVGFLAEYPFILEKANDLNIRLRFNNWHFSYGHNGLERIFFCDLGLTNIDYLSGYKRDKLIKMNRVDIDNFIQRLPY